MTPPMRQMKAVLPVATPSSMIAAFRVGRNSEAVACSSCSSDHRDQHGQV